MTRFVVFSGTELRLKMESSDKSLYLDANKYAREKERKRKKKEKERQRDTIATTTDLRRPVSPMYLQSGGGTFQLVSAGSAFYSIVPLHSQ